MYCSTVQYITVYCTAVRSREAATTTCCWIGAKTSSTSKHCSLYNCSLHSADLYSAHFTLPTGVCTTALCTSILWTTVLCSPLNTVLNIIVLCISVFWTSVLCTSFHSVPCTPVLNTLQNCTVNIIHTVLCEKEHSALQRIAEYLTAEYFTEQYCIAE